jgi:hypothetical protein
MDKDVSPIGCCCVRISCYPFVFGCYYFYVRLLFLLLLKLLLPATAFSGLLKYPGLAKNIQTPQLVRHLGFSHRQTSAPNCSRQLPGAAPGLLHQE